MKFSLQNAIDEVRQLTNRIRAREVLADELSQKIHSVQAKLLSMRQYQEEVLTFDELTCKIGDKVKSPLILCLAAENKQLQQLKVENHALINSLEEHRTVMDIIMTKYREQVSQLLQTNKVERLVQSESQASLQSTRHRESVTAKHPLASSHSSSALDDKSTQQLATQVATLANIARDVSDKGDAYATELEKELLGLRAENAGLRELLDISRSFCIPSTIDGPSMIGTGDRLVSQRNPSGSLDTNQHCDIDRGLPNPLSNPSRQQPFMSVRKHVEEGPKDGYDRVYSLLLCSQTDGGSASSQEDEEASHDLKDDMDDEDAVTVTNSSSDDNLLEPYMCSFHSLG